MYKFILRCLRFLFGVSLASIAVFTQPGLAQSCDKPAATMMSVQGTVEAQQAGSAQWQPAKLNATYCPGDTIRVLERSRADVALENGSVLRLNAKSTITLEGVKEKKTSLISLLKGAGHFFSRGPRNLEVKTPFTVAGVRGTEFLVQVESDKTLLSIFEGAVLASNEMGRLSLEAGQSAVAEQGKAPTLRIVARPRDAVQWALYYPPVIYPHPDQFQGSSAWQNMLQQSTEAYLKGDLQRAFDRIENVPETIRDANFFAYRASLLLAVGRTDDAKADISRTLRLNPGDSNAAALQTIMAIVQNEKDKAFDMAEKAVTDAPQSATAHIALSYVQQARFDLEGARNSLQKAVELEPKNALAWARLAELWSSFGRLNKALDAAQTAVDLEPHLSRTQTVLGFAFLTQVKTKPAKVVFQQAIEFDQADPLPRLGLGLAKIREGNLDDGARDLESAASLSPNNSILHSYLGKARYEAKLHPLDERDFGVAKELDPNDPTPWFYDAIQKQTTNRPVEALHDLQKAIAVNDNRAVYRSQLLLDSDLAARSAGLGRIYSDLGFQQLALVEGWKSVNTDPTNHSAHRFLADSYAALPRHEIARVSELLQSQLLQPINQTPIQPRLAESNLFLISAGGPGSLSFNEFSPLFNRDGVTVQASGTVGEDNTFAGEAVAAGILGKASFSVGYSHFETDGFRQNADQKDDIFNVFAQVELTDQTSVQAEVRRRQSEYGDLQQRFFTEDFFPGMHNDAKTTVLRLGARHAFSAESIILGSFIFTDAPFRQITRDPFPGFTLLDFDEPTKSSQVEFQHLFRSRYINLTTGAGYSDLDAPSDLTLGLIDELGPFEVVLPTFDRSQRHFNIYAYGNISILKNVTVTLGLSFQRIEGDKTFVDGGDMNQINPKFGIVWTPFSGTTIRAAAFRGLRRVMSTDQTLEPTQVAGFNQFYDDFVMTDAWRYGVAIDQHITKDIFVGAELSWRDKENPVVILSDEGNPQEVQKGKEDEYQARAYFFWTPHPWFSLRAEYLFERFEFDESGLTNPKDLDTHRIPFGANFFHPSGFNASLGFTYVNQDGVFERLESALDESGKEDFWLTDLSVGYRLPKRHGFITAGVTNLLINSLDFLISNSITPESFQKGVCLSRPHYRFPNWMVHKSWR